MRLRRWLGRGWIVVLTLAILLALSTVLRLALLGAFVNRASLTLAGVARIMVVGIRFDLLVGLLLLTPQMLHMALYSNRVVQSRMSRLSIGVGLVVTFGGALFITCAEFLFFEEFQSRFNYIAFEYLVYPTEVITNIWESYPLIPILVGIAVAALGITHAMRRQIDRSLAVALPLRRRLGLLAVAVVSIAGLLATTGMSSLGVTTNRAANECAGNGVYSFVYYAWTNRFDFEPFYLTIDQAQAFRRTADMIVETDSSPAVGSLQPLERIVNTGSPSREYNVVLILEESLGSDFVGALGDDRGLTPNLDRLAGDGLLFDRFYATGNRTARALEATLTSIPPIPTESILKRDHSDRVFTLANVLHERSYENVFVYGGRGMFDGMRSFMMNNGFDRFVEQSDYESPTFVTAWGVCDEDIFDRAIAEFDELDARGQPFFSTVLSVSNHRPFTYPDGRIDLPSSDQQRSNAVKYADFALGRFLDEARTHSFFDHTVFVMMGDHGARVYGADMFPVPSYRVPVLMILPEGARAGERCSTLASSLDIAPIVLGVLGGSYRSTFFGRDALRIDPSTAYALMQHNHDPAKLDDDGSLTLLGCTRTSSFYHVDSGTLRLRDADAPDTGELEDTIALYQTANRLYYDDRLFPEAAEATVGVARQ